MNHHMSLDDFLSQPNRDLSLPYTFLMGTKAWFDLEGRYHRDGDLPAVVGLAGDKSWFKHGDPHRDNDLPAVAWDSGYKEWWVNGKHHRATGPATQGSDIETYFLDGYVVTYDEWLEKRTQYLPPPHSRYERPHLL